MSPAGYSGTSLIQKLGIKPEMKLLVLNEPENYFELLETDLKDQVVTATKGPDLIHLFAKDNAAFMAGMKKILPVCKKNTRTIVWVSWFKKSAGVATDLTEDMIRNFALKHELVDIKVCAVSTVWSGLKLVVPVSKR